MTKRVDLIIPRLPGLNTSSRRQHWAVQHKDAKTWSSLVRTGVRRPRVPHAKAEVILRRCSTREPDYDNLVASFKPVVDALVTSGILADDKPSNFKHRRPDYKWAKVAKDHQGIHVEVWA